MTGTETNTCRKTESEAQTSRSVVSKPKSKVLLLIMHFILTFKFFLLILYIYQHGFSMYLNVECRSKLKQTEVECQLLKKNCERLSEENWRLKKELVELRSKMKIQKRCSLHNPKVVN